eukprot:Sspe_Gene.50236::Locus_27788_Transcript_1_1_Confidence_1.000_Length_5323::g.50236::m.50236
MVSGRATAIRSTSSFAHRSTAGRMSSAFLSKGGTSSCSAMATPTSYSLLKRLTLRSPPYAPTYFRQPSSSASRQDGTFSKRQMRSMSTPVMVQRRSTMRTTAHVPSVPSPEKTASTAHMNSDMKTTGSTCAPSRRTRKSRISVMMSPLPSHAVARTWHASLTMAVETRKGASVFSFSLQTPRTGRASTALVKRAFSFGGSGTASPDLTSPASTNPYLSTSSLRPLAKKAVAPFSPSWCRKSHPACTPMMVAVAPAWDPCVILTRCPWWNPKRSVAVRSVLNSLTSPVRATRYRNRRLRLNRSPTFLPASASRMRRFCACPIFFCWDMASLCALSSSSLSGIPPHPFPPLRLNEVQR